MIFCELLLRTLKSAHFETRPHRFLPPDTQPCLSAFPLLGSPDLNHCPALHLKQLAIESPFHSPRLEELALDVTELFQVLFKDVFETEDVVLRIPKRLIKDEKGEY